jgi:hypothetical protein
VPSSSCQITQSRAKRKASLSWIASSPRARQSSLQPACLLLHSILSQVRKCIEDRKCLTWQQEHAKIDPDKMKSISLYDGIVGNSLTKDAIYQPYWFLENALQRKNRRKSR